MESILSALSLTVPVTVNALQKVTAASARMAALDRLKAAEAEVLRAHAAVTAADYAWMLARQGAGKEACKEAILALAGVEGGVNAKDLLAVAGDRFVYTDILLVARELIEAGLIQESRKGRKATWHLTTV